MRCSIVSGEASTNSADRHDLAVFPTWGGRKDGPFELLVDQSPRVYNPRKGRALGYSASFSLRKFLKRDYS